MKRLKLRYTIIAAVVLLAMMLSVLGGCSSDVAVQTAAGGIHADSGNKAEGGGQSEVPEGSSFAVHFIDVGQGDAALVQCDGVAMLIDGGETDQSNKIYAYLKAQGTNHLDYIVATHAHSDHVGGLSGALNYAVADTVYSPVTYHDSRPFENFLKYVELEGTEITVPEPGDSFSLGSASVEILAPNKEYSDVNETSIVLKIVYGATSFLFTGDAGRPSEEDMLDAGYDLSATVLKVGHHGSNVSTTYPFLREVMPRYAVISVGTGNMYGHPHKETMSRLRDADAEVFRTDLQGTIICTSDGQTVTFTTEKVTPGQTGSAAGVAPAQGNGGATGLTETDDGKFIGNVNSGKFHSPDCYNLPEERNRIYFDSRAEALVAGYDPCGNCNP